MPFKQSVISLFITLFLISAGATCSQAQEKCAGTYGAGKTTFSIATGSPGELGLLEILGDARGSKADTTLCWVKAGSGESLQLLKDKKVDMIMVHAPEAEKKAVADGWAANRILIGSNEFYIGGPAADPAKIAQAKNVVDAYTRIASAKAKFISRGDNSGTHKKEMDAWKKAGLTPGGAWYIVTKDFMTATLKRADTEKGYFMTDSSTWAAEKKNTPNLTILFRGDKFLVNAYHTLSMPTGQSSGAAIAAQFIQFVASPDGQKIVRDFGRAEHDEGLYNDADYAKKYDD